MNIIQRGALVAGALSLGVLGSAGSAAASPGIAAVHSTSLVGAVFASSPEPASVEDWYPWGTYASEGQCVDAGNKYLREEPWHFRAYRCQMQGIIWKLYLDEK
ncbi:hypothetical protein [Amycolatopsis sp. NPDC059657]|uniref:hypothetical protein n=1 Tax=Amycolatopsis sp. NPDC059657 TaxID=3346899 RepID=UPI00366AE835